MSIKVTNDTNNGSATIKSAEVAGDCVVTTPAFTTELAPRMQLMTAQNSTSGTAIDFVGIPSWAKRITVMFNGVSTNGTSVVQVQLGSTTIQTTGYTASAGYGVSAGQYVALTTGIPIDGTNSTIASNIRYGVLTFSSMGSSIWTSSLSSNSNGTTTVYGGGSVTLSGTLGRVRITTVNGIDIFDAGQINVLYEG